MLSTTVKTITYSGESVSVTLTDGKILKADYALVSFSLGVLQNDDVTWEPKLPPWKEEAVQSMSMVSDFLPLPAVRPSRSAKGTYTKIFMQFPKKFWFDTEVRLLLCRPRSIL